MKLPSWILFWIFFVQAVHGLNIFEEFLEDFLVGLIRGPRYLEDFPRCGRPGNVSREQGEARRRKAGGDGGRRTGSPGSLNAARDHNGPAGTQDCSYDNKCTYGEGQCRGDYECRSPYVCGVDNCRNFTEFGGQFAESGWDCCEIDQTPAAPPSESDFPEPKIFSEGYPVPGYSNNTDQTWTVTSTSGLIQMTIQYFELEDSTNCVYDKVEILTNGQLRYSYCGSLTVPWVRTFAGPTLEVRFYSDNSVTKQGFLATFLCGSVPCETVEATTTTTVAPVTTTQQPFVASDTCESPNYPENYVPVNETKICEIPNNGANIIEINFLDVVIEAPDYQDPTNCSWDYVRIEEEPPGTPNPLLDKRCGTQLPDSIYSTPGSTVSVYFFADGTENFRGFQLRWKEISTTTTTTTTTTPTTSDTTGPAVTTPTTTTTTTTTTPTTSDTTGPAVTTPTTTQTPSPPTPISTTTNPNTISCTGSYADLACCSQENQCGYGQGDCDNDDECANGLRCGLDNCRDFHVNPYSLSDCCIPFENISPPTATPAARPTAPTTTPATTPLPAGATTTTTAMPTATTTTNPPPPTFTMIEVPSTDKIILSHDGYENMTEYEQNLEKAWKIEVPLEFRIQLKFEGRFDVSSSENGCTDDWVTVYDGETQLLDKTCNFNAELDINGAANVIIPVSNSRSVTVYFKTNDDTNQGLGFNLTRKIVEKKELILPSSDECLWGCTWKENPFYRVYTGWLLPRNRQPLNEDMITILFTSPQIPRNLDCLMNCFNEVKELQETLEEDCTSEGNLDGIPANSNDPNIDCLLFKQGRKYRDGDGIPNNVLSDVPNSVQEAQRKGRQVFNPLEEENIGLIRKHQYLIPSTPLDIALEFCILANMDKRSVLPALDTSDGDIFYLGELLFDGKDCSNFLPNIFSKVTPNTPSNSNRNFGPSSSNVERGNNETSVYPWMCSLKETGYRGRHKCGVTLLSGKSSDTNLGEAPTIFVGAAHCNFVCKDLTVPDNPKELETCCCRDASVLTSCRSNSMRPSSYCPDEAKAVLVAAKEEDLQIVCNLYNTDVIPEAFTDEEEIVITITKISNHPDYSPGYPEDTGANQKGPYAGNDISVYHVDDSKMKLEEGKLWPACLPRDDDPSRDLTSPSKDFFAGWLDPEPYYRINDETSVSIFRDSYLKPRKTQMVEVECKDPEWMRSHSFYPAGTLCFKDPSEGSCFQFGNSGSSVMTHFTEDGESRYAMAGPLSMHKGCDQTWLLNDEYLYASKNPGVITDARCHLGWIAQEYGFSIPGGYTVPESCRQSKGRREDINQAVCRVQTNYYVQREKFFDCFVNNKTSTSTTPAPGVLTTTTNTTTGPPNRCSRTVTVPVTEGYCDWTQTVKDPQNKTQLWDRCRLAANEGFSYNVYQCLDYKGQLGTCSNNCRGVDPNAIIIGGAAVLAASGIAAQTALQLGLGLVGAPPAAAAIGMAGAMFMSSCPSGQCLARNARRPRQRQCCPLRLIGGRTRCPRRC